MSARDEVLREFEEHVSWVQRQRMADEIVDLRERLAALEENSVSGALFDTVRDVAHQMERERDQFASMLFDCENERDGYMNRAGRTAQVLAALREPSEAVVKETALHGWAAYDPTIANEFANTMARRVLRAAVAAAEKEVDRG